jgi:hypothetical protein
MKENLFDFPIVDHFMIYMKENLFSQVKSFPVVEPAGST